MQKFLLIIFLIFCLGILVLPDFVFGYQISPHNLPEKDNIVIAPTKYVLEVLPGKTYTRNIVIANRTPGDVNFGITTVNFKPGENDEIVFYSEGAERFISRYWFKPEIEKFVLKKGEQINFDVSIKVPADAEPGGYYSAVLAEASGGSTSLQGQSQISVLTRVGVLFLLKVPGDILEKGTLESFQTDKKFFKEEPITFSLVFQNSGNIHLAPEGSIIIRNFLGQKTAELPIYNWYILPLSRRGHAVSWEPQWRFGLYSAEINLQYGSISQTASKKTYFFVLSWKVGTAALAIILIWLGWWRIKKFQKSHPTGGHPKGEKLNVKS